MIFYEYFPSLSMKMPGGDEALLTTSLPTTQSLLLILLLQKESRLLGKTVENRPGTGKIQCGPCVYFCGKMDVVKSLVGSCPKDAGADHRGPRGHMGDSWRSR